MKAGNLHFLEFIKVMLCTLQIGLFLMLLLLLLSTVKFIISILFLSPLLFPLKVLSLGVLYAMLRVM